MYYIYLQCSICMTLSAWQVRNLHTVWKVNENKMREHIQVKNNKITDHNFNSQQTETNLQIIFADKLWWRHGHLGQ